MKELRISLVIIAGLLISIGIIFIYSASGVSAFEDKGDSAYFLKRHVTFLVMGSFLTFLTMQSDYRLLRSIAKPLLLTTIFLLILVLIPGIGKATFGARRWFNFGFFSFQPSELAKLTVIIYAADFLARKRHKLHSFVHGFLPLIMVTGFICLLVIKQPDLGTTVLLMTSVLLMMYLAGVKYLHLCSMIVAALPVVYILIVKVPYRWARIQAFLDPWKDSQGIGFQLTQSQIALGSGGLLGVGLGQSAQKLFYLPAAHTDFIFSIIGEETGLLGTLAVILLLIAFIWQGARIVKRTADPFGHFLAAGIVIMMGLQSAVNVGVSIGALPTKGLPLPFISYGGSALIFTMLAVGLLLNISRVEDISKE